MPATALDHGLKIFSTCPPSALTQPKTWWHTGVVFECAVASTLAWWPLFCSTGWQRKLKRVLMPSRWYSKILGWR